MICQSVSDLLNVDLDISPVLPDSAKTGTPIQFFDTSGLASSPEHPQINSSWATNPQVDSGYGLQQPMLLSRGLATNFGFGSGGAEAGHTFMSHGIMLDAIGQPQCSMDTFQTQMNHTLSHASSTSSLTSLTSLVPSQAGSTSSLFVEHFPPENSVDLSQLHTRHNSLSLDDKDQCHDNEATMAMWSMPTNLQTHASGESLCMMPGSVQPEAPKRELQTHSWGGRVMGKRTRSSSRVQPYQRERSDSVSVKSEAGDDISALLSSSTSYSNLKSPWSATTNNALIGGLNTMTLHQRRTSSNASTFSQKNSSPVRPMLSRAHRSLSLAMEKGPQFDLTLAETAQMSSAEERETAVRAELVEQAEEVKKVPQNSQQDKARGMWVRRWLQLCYSRHPCSTVPRQGLYHSYTLSCEEYGLRPINSASFGKAVRGAFPAIKTRRLGHRGNSQYHYVSLRPSIRIEAMRLNDYGDSSGQWHVAPEDGSMGFQQSSNYSEAEMIGEDVDDTEIEDEDESYLFPPLKTKTSNVDICNAPHTGQVNNMARRLTESVIPSSRVPSVASLASFPTLHDVIGNPDMNNHGLQEFCTLFCQHQEAVCKAVRDFRFDVFEVEPSQCRNFWATLDPNAMAICQRQDVSHTIDTALGVTYDHCLSILLGKLLHPINLPTQKSLRDLAQNFEQIITASLLNFTPKFREPKIELSVRAVRYIDVHQLTVALSLILSAQKDVQRMLAAWEALDVQPLLDQCALASNCDPSLLEPMLKGFHLWLVQVEAAPSRGGKAIESLGKFVDQVLRDAQGSHPGRLPVPNRALIVRSGFITSQVMRDFTLKSNGTIGLFQLVKTWIDDWISLSVLRQTTLCLDSLDMNGPSFNPEVSALIRSQQSAFQGTDLSTAAPFHHASMAGAVPDFGLPASHFFMSTFNTEPTTVTPRPPLPSDGSQNWVNIENA